MVRFTMNMSFVKLKMQQLLRRPRRATMFMMRPFSKRSREFSPSIPLSRIHQKMNRGGSNSGRGANLCGGAGAPAGRGNGDMENHRPLLLRHLTIPNLWKMSLK